MGSQRVRHDWAALLSLSFFQKKTPVHMSYQHPRMLLAGIHLGWAMRTQPGRTLSQNDWPETTQEIIPSYKTQDREPQGRPVLLGPHTLLLSAQAPLPNKVSLSARVSPWTIHFSVLDKSPLLCPGRGSPSCYNSSKFIKEGIWRPLIYCQFVKKSS